MQPPLPPDAVRELVCSCLHRDPVAADLRCSLFVAAAQNYKRDSVLRPYPPRYIRDRDTKEFDELVRNWTGQKTLIFSISKIRLDL
jgi:poly[ADP-ribose] polymerase 16